MKYITRELYQEMQHFDAGKGCPFESKWNARCEAYQKHRAEIEARLPESMRSFCQKTFHDGIVVATIQPTPDVIEIKIDATHCPWGPKGHFRIRFDGVQLAEGLDEMVGDDWLYEEVHLHPNAGFEYHVLLFRSEFKVAADSVTIENVQH